MPDSSSPAQRFFDDHVIPNYNEWLARPTDLRFAMNVTLSLYHMTDHFWHAFNETEPSRVFDAKEFKGFRDKLKEHNSEYAWIRDIADAHKHMKLTMGIDKRTVKLSEQTKISSTGFGEGAYRTGPFGGGPSIVVELNDGSKRHLSFSLKQVKELWDSMLP